MEDSLLEYLSMKDKQQKEKKRHFRRKKKLTPEQVSAKIALAYDLRIIKELSDGKARIVHARNHLIFFDDWYDHNYDKVVSAYDMFMNDQKFMMSVDEFAWQAYIANPIVFDNYMDSKENYETYMSMFHDEN